MNGTLANNIVYLEEGVVVYVAGGFLVRLNLATRAQDIAPLAGATPSGAPTLGATAIAVSPSKRLIAVAESSSREGEGAIITIYSARTLSRRRTLLTASPENGPSMPLAARPALARPVHSG